VTGNTMAVMPTVHLNGTSLPMLIDDYSNAIMAVEKAIEELRKVEFHARDYYVSPDPNAWEKARAEREETFAHLYTVRDNIQDILSHLTK
jgi:hypothetical protein